ncbi:DUF2721 domain-containing protein [Nocardioides cynanchi]|uniref:DUF2721 domain-containing protein n=1 Tax=Nocardioides cynanchi TaxID=2558918 RepID=UPI00124915B4|nr:DUF2721 domain-containing protein [Nocardioides cynanchi]
MTEQPGNPTDPTQPDPAASSDAAPTPPPAAPTPPAQSSAPAAGASQYDFNQAKSTLQGAHKFDLGIMAAGLVAFIAGLLPFYTISVSAGGFGGASDSVTAWHGFFGWFGVLLALVGAVVVALALFANVTLPMPLYQLATAAFGAALICLILALFVIPGGGCNGAGAFGVKCDTGHGIGYWLALLAVIAGLALSVLRMRETTTTGTTAAA